jgi:hypothetical protein
VREGRWGRCWERAGRRVGRARWSQGDEVREQKERVADLTIAVAVVVAWRKLARTASPRERDLKVSADRR